MKIFKPLFLIFSFFLILNSINICSAYTYSGLFTYPVEIDYVDDDTFIVTDSTDDTIYYFYPDNFGSSSTKVTGFTYLTDTHDFVDGNWLSLKWSGSGTNDVLIYQSPTGLSTYANLSTSNIAQITEGWALTVDNEYNTYVITDDGNYLYKIEYPTYTQQLLGTVPTYSHGTICVAPHPEGLLIGTSTTTTTTARTANIYLYNESGFTSILSINKPATGGATSMYISSLYSDSIGNIFLGVTGSFTGGYVDTNGNTFYRNGLSMLSYDNFTEVTTIESNAGNSISDIEIDSEGIIYACVPASGNIITYSNPTGYGGYSTLDAGTIAATFDYEKQLSVFNYDTYYNNSDIECSYNIITTSLTESEINNFKNTYDFRFELLDNNNAIIKTHIINGAYFSEDTYYDSWASYLTGGDTYLYDNGVYTFNNNENWESGTYTLKAYEYNSLTGGKALLYTDTTTILNESYTGTITTDVDESSFDLSSLSIELLNSPYFHGGLLVIVFGGAGATFGGAIGFAIGAFIGVCLAVAINLIGAWVIIAIIVVAVFALAFFKN